MRYGFLPAAAAGLFLLFGAPTVVSVAQDNPSAEQPKAPANAKEVMAEIQKAGQALGEKPTDEQVDAFFGKAWSLVAAYLKANPEAADAATLYQWSMRRAGYGKNNADFLDIAQRYLKANPEAKDAAQVRLYYLAGSLSCEAFKAEATAEMAKLDEAAKADAAKFLQAVEIRLMDAGFRKDDAAKAKQIEAVKASELVKKSEDVWVARDAQRIVLSSTTVEVKDGEAFPDWADAWAVKDLDGKAISVAEYKGKVVLLDFWATLCGPCVREMPSVVKAYAAFQEKGFEVIGLSFDNREGEQSLRDTIAGKGKVGQMTGVMPWRQVYDGGYWNSGLAKRYGIRGIPHTVLIGRDGKVVAQDLRGEELLSKIKELVEAGAEAEGGSK
ncbi:MAG: TlpA family protein disulfide reductase [Planctomycetes bacterium]|nr:TlpA family protein disulfide reductase [Planctomycetota bacterium]